MLTKPILLVTGASRGIGAATARLAAKSGWAVVVNYFGGRTAAEGVVSDIRATGGEAVAVQADVSDEAQVLAMYDRVDLLGTLFGLVNNAGVVDVSQRLEDMSVIRMRRLFNTNVLGSMVCAREAIKRMSTKNGGSGGVIVNLSSAAARLGAPGHYVDYAATKGAIDSFTVGLAKEVAAEGIRVNAIRPGSIDTDIHSTVGIPGRLEQIGMLVPMGRVGTAAEVAEAIVWLLSPRASYVTNSILDVTGGR